MPMPPAPAPPAALRADLDPAPASRATSLRCFVLLALWLIMPGAALADDYERWYRINMSDQPAGYMHAARKSAEGLITTSSTTALSIRRGPITISITMSSEFVEKATGEPVSMKTVEQFGQIPSTTHYTFADGKVHIRREQADQVTESTIDAPEGPWLTPAASQTYLRQRLAAGADRIVVRALDPLSGPQPQTTTRTAISRATLEVLGKSVEVFRCIATTSAAPGVESVEYIDPAGIPVQVAMTVATMPLVVKLSTREQALAAGAELAPELMLSTFIKPDRRIRSPRKTTEASYLLSVDGGTIPPIPPTSVQRTERIDDRTLRITVDLASPAAAEAAEAEDKSYLESSAMISAEDPRIKRLIERAVKDAGEDPAARAEAMRAFVYRFIDDKDLDVGFASASEVARSRRGDCSEHGVLLAAMLRADGIPSRVASGLIYADRFAGERHIFGYHMWTQALLEIDGQPTWVDLDATLPGPAFDATHIALVVSALKDGEATTSLAALLPLIGQLEINVESFK